MKIYPPKKVLCFLSLSALPHLLGSPQQRKEKKIFDVCGVSAVFAVLIMSSFLWGNIWKDICRAPFRPGIKMLPPYCWSKTVDICTFNWYPPPFCPSPHVHDSLGPSLHGYIPILPATKIAPATHLPIPYFRSSSVQNRCCIHYAGAFIGILISMPCYNPYTTAVEKTSYTNNILTTNTFWGTRLFTAQVSFVNKI